MVSKAVSDRQRQAGYKAAATLRRRKANVARRQKAAAVQAWQTRKSPPHKAKKTALRSQDALKVWCKKHGWRLVFLDAQSGNPRTGIVDAVLLRIAKGSPDKVEIRLVQLKGGGAGLKPYEPVRLERAVNAVDVKAFYVLHDRDDISVLNIDSR